MANTRVFPTLALVALMAACSPAGGPGTSGDSPFPPSGPGDPADAVDQMVVGHRLMAVGEYELALRAYLLAASEEGYTVDVLSSLGSANLRLGRLNQAERLLRRAIDEDETFAPAYNNLGVVLVERGLYGEASQMFRAAFALDSGESAEIRENLRLALANLENPAYSEANEDAPALVRRGTGDYLLLVDP